MQWKNLVWVGAGLLALAPSAVLATGQFSVHGGVGYNKALNDGYPDGSLGIQGGVLYNAQPNFGLGLEVGYLGLGSYSASYEGVNGKVDGDISISQIPVNGIFQYSFHPSGRVQPMLMGGVGLYSSRIETKLSGATQGFSASTSTTSTASDFGFNAGAGVKLGRSSQAVRFGGDARFHLVMTEGESTKMLNVMGRVYFN
ncbi:MAG: outer membrane beta-barrel protein [Candidatus Eisenbacteria bacterium]